MRWFRDASLRSKLIIIVSTVVTAAVISSSVANYFIDLRERKSLLVTNMTTLADVIGGQCVAALKFEDPASAAEVLDSLKLKTTVVFACVYDANGKILATYRPANSNHVAPIVAPPDGDFFNDEADLELTRPIAEHEKRVGTIYLRTNMSEAHALMRKHFITKIIVSVVALTASVLLALWSQRLISRPILRLARTLETIAPQGDYSLRVQKEGNDEVGTLYDGFNAMLTHIQKRDTELEQHRLHLEALVQERTRDLERRTQDLGHLNADLKLTNARLAQEVTARGLADDRLTAQYAIVRILTEVPDLTEAIQRILQAACETLKWDFAAFWRVDPDQKLLYCVETWHPPHLDFSAFENATRQSRLPPGIGLSGRAWSSGNPAWVMDPRLDGDCPRSPFALQYGLNCGFAFPVRTSGEIIGVLELFSREFRPQDVNLLPIFSVLGDQIGQFLERKRVEGELALVAAKLALSPPQFNIADLRFPISRFSLTDMMDSGAVIRGMSSRHASAEGLADELVRFLYDHIVDDTDHRALALVRMFAISSYANLNDEQKAIAANAYPSIGPETKCLFLLSTAGDEPDWNDRHRSAGHRVIPLPSKAAVEQLPMIAQLIRGLGFEVSGVLQPEVDVLVQSGLVSHRWPVTNGHQSVAGNKRARAKVFHVAEAVGSPHIPSQDFVQRYAIRSVIGFGDMLPDGQLFAVIAFSRVPITREIAGLFSHLSLSMLLALLPNCKTDRKIESQITSLDRLLTNHEEIVAKQDVKLRAALVELGRSNTDLEQFAYAASHDLQEPLRAVAGYCQLLQRTYQDKLDEQGNGFLKNAVEGSQRMSALIRDLLEFARVTRRGEPFQQTDCNEVVSQALTQLKVAIEECGGRVEYAPLPTCSADKGQLIRLFQNLIGNALKFRGTRPPEIYIAAGETADEWRFSVRDNGIGIDPKYQERIFVIFQRLHTREEFPGTGIGLAVCKRIVERHNGRIWVESIPGEGSTFFFTIAKRLGERT